MLGYNGYIHTRMVRARVLHKYLCKVAGLGGNPPFTAPQLASPESQAQQVGQPATQNRTSTGAAGRPAVLPGSVAGSFRLLNIPLQSSLNAAAAASGARAGAASNAAAAAGSGGALHVKASGDGVVLLVSDIWSYMPIELALQVRTAGYPCWHIVAILVLDQDALALWYFMLLVIMARITTSAHVPAPAALAPASWQPLTSSLDPLQHVLIEALLLL